MTGPVQHAVVLQAASLLLQYPDARIRGALPTVRAALEPLPPGAPRDGLLGLAGQLAAGPAEEGELHYVEVFDRRRRCCLYLTWWTDGETRRRGLALARLKQRYRAAGLELVGTELPDHLPVVLEFAAADVPRGLELLQQHRPGLELLRLALAGVGTPYVAALEAVCALLPGASPADEAAARALARSGPPQESVGLEPFGLGSGADAGAAAPWADLGPTSLEPTGVRR